MVFKVRLSVDQRKHVIFPKEQKRYSYRKIALDVKMSKSSVPRFVRGSALKEPRKGNVKSKLGRPESLTGRDKRKIEQPIVKLKQDPNPTVTKVGETSGVSVAVVSYRTFAKYIRKMVNRFPETLNIEKINTDDYSKREGCANKFQVTGARL